ncbi:MAG: hypothetical protein A2Y80_01415 [Deltaproteobacteria bacterium RBG_13_58_19]|nr:MAG: hypothetical protein A2Y80_01415 [Deltaproteobacteria bacterium RBG_13_58_19]
MKGQDMTGGELLTEFKKLREQVSELKRLKAPYQQTEEEVRESLAYLENVFENSPDVIGVVDKQGKFIKVNKMTTQVFGYTYDALKGKPSLDLYADKNEYDKMLKKLRHDGHVQRYVIDMKTKKGKIIPFEVSIIKLKNNKGNVIGSVCIARDISDIKEALTSIKAKNEQLETEINERRRAEEAAEQASAKLQAMVYEYSQRNREASLLNKMGEFLQACLTPEEAHPIIARYASELFPGSSGGLFMLNSSENMVEIVSSWGEPLWGERMFPPKDCWAIRRGRPHLVEDLGKEVVCQHLLPPKEDSYFCLPLMAQGAILGMVHLQSCQTMVQPKDDFPQGMPTLGQQRQLAITFTEHIALALSNLKLRETLRHMAIRDPLTGLFNRRYLEETVEREIHRVNRKGTKMGVMMLDLDHFKGFNDCYGHEAGDVLLRALGSYLKQSVRADDMPCRYGGEEFTLIMPEISFEIALDRAETIREGVKHLQIQHHGQRLTDVTISIGVAIYPDHGDSWEATLKAADEALYKAKISGRNKVVAAGQNEYLGSEVTSICQGVTDSP